MTTQPARKKKRSFNIQRGWLSFLSTKNYTDYTKEWTVTYQQQISINPKYLKLRTELFLLEVLEKLVLDGSVKSWRYEDLQNKDRVQLSEIILALLKSEKNVNEYISIMRTIQIRESKARKKIRRVIERVLDGQEVDLEEESDSF